MPFVYSTEQRRSREAVLAYAVGGATFLRAGAFQKVIGDLVNVSQPTVWPVVGNVTNLITQELTQTC